MTTTTLTSGGASDYLSLSNGDDGTLTVKVGPTGAKVNALVIDAAGTPTFIKQPVLPVQSMVRLNTANGYGSTNTKIRRFTNVVTNQGSDITYVDSATLGSSFTVNTSGVYAISYSDSLVSASGYSGISVNSSQLTASIHSITASDIYALGLGNGSGQSINTIVTTYLASGAVVRAHTSGDAAGTAVAQFVITRVA